MIPSRYSHWMRVILVADRNYKQLSKQLLKPDGRYSGRRMIVTIISGGE